MNDSVKRAIDKNGWAMIYFHSITRNGDQDETTAPFHVFKEHLDFIDSVRDCLWIAPQGQIAQYIRLRQYGSFNVDLVNKKIIEIEIDTHSQYRFRDVALDIYVDLPSAWLHRQIIVSCQNQECVIDEAPAIAHLELDPYQKMRIYAPATKASGQEVITEFKR
jgi:hypothetical protein